MAPRAISTGHGTGSEHDEDTSFPGFQRRRPSGARWIVSPEVLGEDDELDVSATRRPLASDASDRMRPQVAGGMAGLFAGAAALAVVHYLAPQFFARPIDLTAAARGVDPRIAYGIAYATAGAAGALTGAAFAMLTRYLRRWFALLVWAEIFFISLTTLVLAILGPGRGVAVALVGPILAASAAYAFVVAISLPIRRRR